MFESLQGGNGRNFWDRIKALLLSVFIHAAMIIGAIVLPLVFLQALPGVDFLTYLMAAPPPPETPAAPAPPPQNRIAAAARPVVTLSGFIPPVTIPAGIQVPDEEPPTTGIGLVGGGIGPTGLLTGPPGITGISYDLFAAPPAPLPLPPLPKRTPVPIGGKVQEAKLIRKVLPEYSVLARNARVEGEVILAVNVDEEGNVAGVRVIKGHPLLEEAAVRAVRQWKYSPTLLNGEPVPVLSTVTVIFRLSGRTS
jgi:protein TonB